MLFIDKWLLNIDKNKMKMLPCGISFDMYVYPVHYDNIIFDFGACNIFKARMINIGIKLAAAG